MAPWSIPGTEVGMPKRLLIAATIAAALLAPAGTAHAALPPQGVYDACGPGSDGNAECVARLDRAAGAGFKLILNYTLWYGTAGQVREYLDAAHARGLQVIVPFNAKQWRNGADLRRHYGRISPGCGCSNNDGFMRFAVGLVKNHPAVWGHYIGDEVNPNEAHLVATLAARVKALDPAHPTFYISLEDHGSPGANLAPFAALADAIGSDSYPIGWGGPPETVGGIANAVRDLASRHGKGSAFVLQAFSWEMYPSIAAPDARWPTVDEMRRMRDSAIANANPGFLLWYSMHDILESPDPERHWADLVAAAFAADPRDKPELASLRVSTRIANQRTTRARLRKRLKRCRKVRSSADNEACRDRAWRLYHRGPAVRWNITAPGTVTVTISRLDRKSRRSSWQEEELGRVEHAAAAGPGALRLTGRLARRAREPGRYRIRVTVRSPSGEVSARPRTMKVSKRR